MQTGTAYEIIPGSVASNATVWECDSSNCPPTAGSFDLTRFNVSYWQNYERLLGTMQELGVVADIIVFHPYDRGYVVVLHRVRVRYFWFVCLFV